MSEIILKTASRNTQVSRSAVRDAVMGAFISGKGSSKEGNFNGVKVSRVKKATKRA
jgi:hypothetical protein